MGLLLFGTTPATNPGPGPEPYVLPGAVVTSDSFTGGDAATVNARLSDALQGGTPRVWVAGSGGIRIVGGALAAPVSAATGIAVLPCSFADMSVQAKITTLPTTGILVLLVRGQTALVDVANSSYRVNIPASGVMSLQRRSGGVTTALNSNIGTCVVGDTVRLQVLGSQVRVFKNDVQAYSITDANVPSGAFAGITTSTAAGWVVDDVIIRRVV